MIFFENSFQYYVQIRFEIFRNLLPFSSVLFIRSTLNFDRNFRTYYLKKLLLNFHIFCPFFTPTPRRGSLDVLIVFLLGRARFNFFFFQCMLYFFYHSIEVISRDVSDRIPSDVFRSVSAKIFFLGTGTQNIPAYRRLPEYIPELRIMLYAR